MANDRDWALEIYLQNSPFKNQPDDYADKIMRAIRQGIEHGRREGLEMAARLISEHANNLGRESNA